MAGTLLERPTLFVEILRTTTAVRGPDSDANLTLMGGGFGTSNSPLTSPVSTRRPTAPIAGGGLCCEQVGTQTLCRGTLALTNHSLSEDKKERVLTQRDIELGNAGLSNRQGCCSSCSCSYSYSHSYSFRQIPLGGARPIADTLLIYSVDRNTNLNLKPACC